MKVALFLLLAFGMLGTKHLNAQDGCDNALLIACGDEVTGTTVGASINEGPNCFTSVGNSGVHWYQFIGTGEIVNVTTCNEETNYDTKIHVYSGPCGAYTCVAGNDDMDGAGCSLNQTSSSVAFLSVVDLNYFVVIGGFSSNEGAYVATLTCAASFFGCTNVTACNYEPLANTEDGTCESISCAGCTDPIGCNFDPLATLDSGTCDFSCFGCLDVAACNFSAVALFDDGSCCNEICITLEVTEGGFPEQVEWTIEDATGVFLASGGAGTFSFCLTDGCFRYEMSDGLGNGWNGATYTFSNAEDVILTGDMNTATFGDGDSFGVEVLQIGNGCAFGCMDELACNYDVEADFDFACESSSCLGCVDPLATNYNENATIDDGTCIFCSEGEALLIIDMADQFGDGWNGATWSVFDGLGEQIASGDLDNAAFGNGTSIGTDFACLNPGCYTFEVSNGLFPFEIDWFLSDWQGNSYGFGEPGELEFDLGFTGTCGIEGCTDANCAGYNLSASIDDGSCVCPPLNNTVCDAEEITCGDTVYGTTIESSDTEDLVGTNCGDFYISSPGVWYKYIANADEFIAVSTCNTEIGDTKLHVFSAAPDCNNLTCIGGNDDACAFRSEIYFNAELGPNITSMFLSLERDLDSILR